MDICCFTLSSCRDDHRRAVLKCIGIHQIIKTYGGLTENTDLGHAADMQNPNQNQQHDHQQEGAELKNANIYFTWFLLDRGGGYNSNTKPVQDPCFSESGSELELEHPGHKDFFMVQEGAEVVFHPQK